MMVLLDYPWIVHFVALCVDAGLLVYLFTRHRVQSILEARLAIYLGVAAFSNLALVLSFGRWAFPEINQTFVRAYIYAASALPLGLYALVRAFIRLERRPYGLLGGGALIVALIAADLFQLSLALPWDVLTSAEIVLALRLALWICFNGFVFLFGMREFWLTTSPLHRNRLLYLAVASPFLFGDGFFDLTLGAVARPFAVGLQLLGMVVLSYATLEHALIDLRTLLRQIIYYLAITTFTLLLYLLAVAAAVTWLQGADSSRMVLGVLAAGLALTFVYQPLRDWARRGIRSAVFGRQHSARSVVQDFSQRLSARIDLEELAQEGRAVLARQMGARGATLLLATRHDAAYLLRPVQAQVDVPPEIRLDATASIITVIAQRGVPLLQYDVDRLPQYADIPREVRLALQKLRGEVYVPVLSRGALIGVWVIGAKLSGDRYTDADLSLLSTLADQSAVALENARLLADLREQMLQIRTMRDYLDSTMASIATGVLTLDREGRIVSFNRAAEEIFHVPTAKAIGKYYDQVLPTLEGAQMPLLLARVGTTSSQHVVRDAVTQVAGRGQVHLTLQLSAMWRGDEIVGVAIVVEDLTEQARLEMERRAQEKEKEHIRGTFERYVAPTVVEGLLADPRRVQLGGERQLVTVLFADIHGFTKLSEQLSPEALVNVLNGYLALAAKTILHYEGTLDKFLGDGVMAIFNAPLPQADHAWRAACAAVAIQREIAAYTPTLPAAHRLCFRIGLHTGDAVVGNIGTRELMNYTAVGDTVNVSKRLQENADNNQILISRSTWSLIRAQAVTRPGETLVVKNRATPVEVHELVGLKE